MPCSTIGRTYLSHYLEGDCSTTAMDLDIGELRMDLVDCLCSSSDVGQTFEPMGPRTQTMVWRLGIAIS